MTVKQLRLFRADYEIFVYIFVRFKHLVLSLKIYSFRYGNIYLCTGYMYNQIARKNCAE